MMQLRVVREARAKRTVQLRVRTQTFQRKRRRERVVLAQVVFLSKKQRGQTVKSLERKAQLVKRRKAHPVREKGPAGRVLLVRKRVARERNPRSTKVEREKEVCRWVRLHSLLGKRKKVEAGKSSTFHLITLSSSRFLTRNTRATLRQRARVQTKAVKAS